MPSPRLDSLSIKDARALALAAQGFDSPRTKTKSTTADAVALIKKLGVIQIDSVNVLVRSLSKPCAASANERASTIVSSSSRFGIAH